MKLQALLLCAMLGILIGIPLMVRNGPDQKEVGQQLVIISPHNEQIRFEFGAGFEAWHQREFGTPVHVEWSTPGGTSEIRRLLTSQFSAALERGSAPGGNADVLFGGGTFEFMQLSRPLEITVDGQIRSTTILEPAGFTPDWLQSIYGANEVGGRALYDAKGHWFGVALSTFGIISNVELCSQLGVTVPTRWVDLADPKLFNSVSMANPAQSGSVATAFETLLLKLGWERGWQVLRRAAANSRSITGSSAKSPIDVAEGEAACGVAIDFFGRAEVQSLREAARIAERPSLERLVFNEAQDATVVDADPVAVLRGAPNRELAVRFIRFCLSRDGQALWQFDPGVNDACGLRRPLNFSLRRMPALRSMYECCIECFVDKDNPFVSATPLPDNPNFRPFVSPLFTALAVDNDDLLVEAWHKITTHPAYPHDGGIVVGSQVANTQLRKWLELFDAMPAVDGPSGQSYSLGDPASLADVRSGWLKGKWRGEGLWDVRADPVNELRRRAAAFFEHQLSTIIADEIDTESSGSSASQTLDEGAVGSRLPAGRSQ